MALGSIQKPSSSNIFSWHCTWPLSSHYSRIHFRLGPKCSYCSRCFWNTESRKILIPQGIQERRYALRVVKQRLHQSSFREAVIAAYSGRCAVSGLPERRLLDAAHIISDKNEFMGQPVITNGLPLSKIHHSAFDSNLIGINPDYRLHVSERLLSQNDGPMLESFKQLNGNKLRLPTRLIDYPDRERLALRFEEFRASEL